MRKILCFTAVFAFILGGFAQLPQRGFDFKLLNEMKAKAPDVSPDGADLSIINFFPGQTDNIYFSTIGNTYFDTQTYNSGNLMNRIYSYPDETIGATWMHVGETGTPDRGTAYNYFDGTEWGEQQPHIGAASKTGFPSYAPWGPGGEVVSHYQYISGDGPIKILRRETKGVGTWLESTLLPPAGNHSLVWHSMVTSGVNHEFIHLLALVYDDPYLGQDDALLYYRSSDGGVTWDINGVVIEGLGDTYYPSIPSLKYSWAQPVGNTIAFTFGFDEFDGLVFKSTDNGTTWQKTVVYDSPYDPLDVPSTIDTYGSGDGTSAIVLDANGMAHVVFSRMLRSHSGTTWYYSPLGSEGVIYWNETMPSLDSTIVSSYTLDNLLSNGNLVGWITGDVTIVEGQPDYGVSLTSQPQLSISPDGELGLVYTAVSPENKLGSDYYRHLYFTRSMDGGSTWSEPYPLNEDIEFSFSECVFPALAPLYSSKMQVLFQEDYTPGTGEGNGLGEENYMKFLTLLLYTTDSKEFDKESGLEVSQNYPNPATRSTQVCVNLKKSTPVTVRITDLPGKTLQVSDKGLLTAGVNYLTVDVSSLKSGVYYYTVEANNQKVTRKLVVN
jgi:hypothetical protein